MEWGQPTNGSAARRHSSQSHRFAVRVWSNLCICSPGVVKLVRSNLAPDFPLFHVHNTKLSIMLICLSEYRLNHCIKCFIYFLKYDMYDGYGMVDIMVCAAHWYFVFSWHITDKGWRHTSAAMWQRQE